ncbi:hypothetical protein GSI_05193 [Ganoderma sinense ZZ0214-1]|uniref:Fungal-type protein kinase domain-containing protein n=1 Tax=Ganoderma sinense ZZ0214-1 TaxID=1077348 RepID=A0A2G8SFE6_9APHY|nr:hypothetical protein GSI_05193 [Ganoderma sinense ZZ0214-1]
MNHIIHFAFDEFRRRFFGSSSRTSRSSRRSSNAFKTLKNADNMSVNELSDVFIDAVDTHDLIPGSTMACHTRNTEATSEDVRHKSNVAIFPRASRRGLDPLSWTDQTVPVVFAQPAIGADPFDPTEPEYPQDEIQDMQEISLKQISTAAELLFAAQHRVAVFMLFVIGRRFRFVRWDRAGLIVTPAIDYYDEQVLLSEALGLLSRLDAVGLGFDPSATRVLPGTAEFLQMDYAARKNPTDVNHDERDLGDLEGAHIEGPITFEYVRSLFSASLATDWPRYRLEISSGTATRYYLVGKPNFLAEGVAGRGTRGYVAFDPHTGRFLWLKDVWRMSHVVAKKEGDIIHRLNVAGVDGVPTLVCHGDVLDQVTLTSDWSCTPSLPTASRASASSSSDHSKTLSQDYGVYDPPAPGPLGQHTHYRIAVEEVCLPLYNFVNGKQLVSLVLDALRTHYEVATNPQTHLLHCDISGGNIMIYPKIKHNPADGRASLAWTGILSDWELSKSMDDQKVLPKATQAHRLGTYQFMSINLLQEPARPVQIPDELESFFHVLVYHAVRHLRSTCERPSWWITDYFYRYDGPQRLCACGLKSTTIERNGRLETQSPPGPLLFSSPLDDLLFEVLQSLKALYKVRDHDRQQALTPPPAPPPAIAPTGMTAAQRRILDTIYHIDEKILAQLDAERAAQSLVDRGPTAEERELAAKLADHAWMLAHLERFLEDPRWPDDDRIPRAPLRRPPPPASSPSGDPQPNAHAPSRSESNASANPGAEVAGTGKRRRQEEPLSGLNGDQDRAAKRQRTTKPKPKPKPVRKAQAPARPSTHAMRTRSQARRERAAAGGLAR